MKAVCWYGPRDVRVERVPDPGILNARDAIVRVTRTAICGSDLHFYNGFMPTMEPGDILGHEFIGEVMEVGADVRRVKKGDRVVVPFAIACGSCWFCTQDLTALCDNTNPNAHLAETLYGFSGAGLFGSSHLHGGYAGGQAEYVRVPHVDVGALTLPPDVSDEHALFLSDVFPTGWMAAEQCGIRRGDTIAVWGCGPVGLFAIKSAWLLGADRVIAVDRFEERLEMASRHGKAETIDYEDVDAVEALRQMTGGRGPDACIDAVGMEAHGATVTALYDRAKQALMLETDRPTALRQAIVACRKGGTLSIPGVYGGFIDKVPLGAAFAKGLTLRMGHTNVHRYLRPLLARVQHGDVDPTFIITHRMSLDDAPHGYEIFCDKMDRCVKVVLTPWDERE